MKKSDLKSGMIVEIRDGGEGDFGLLVQNNIGLLMQFSETWGSVDALDEEMIDRIDRNFEIVSVRKPKFAHQIIRKYMHQAPIIWERIEEIRIV